MTKYTPCVSLPKGNSQHHIWVAGSTQLCSKTRSRKGALLFALMIMLLVFPLVSAMSFSKSPLIIEEPVAIVSAEPPELNLTYYSLENMTKVPLEENDHLTGDQIMINATWAPETNITKTALEIRAPAIPTVVSVVSNSSSIEINTRKLGNNATCVINASVWWGGGYLTRKLFHDVFIGNFFVPHVELEKPNGGEIWIGANNVTWNAWDNNRRENLTFEVLLSADSGETYQLLRSGLNRTWYTWNSTGFYNLTTYKIQVRASDGIYMVSDESDETFTAGDVTTGPPPTTTTTTTTETTTTTTGPPTLSPQIGALIAIIIVASAFLAVGVYYAAKTRV